MATQHRSGQLGNMAPLHHEFEIRVDSSKIDGLDIIASSGGSSASAPPLRVKRAGSTVEGSTVGTDIWQVGWNGPWGYRVVESIATGASAVTLSASDSGKFLTLGDCTGNDVLVTLPAPDRGIWYEFYNMSPGVGASGPLTVQAPTTGTMVIKGDNAADLVRIGGTATATAEGGSLRVITDGTKWYTIMQPNVSSAAMATATMTLFDVKS